MRFFLVLLLLCLSRLAQAGSCPVIAVLTGDQAEVDKVKSATFVEHEHKLWIPWRRFQMIRAHDGERPAIRHLNRK